MSKYVIENYTPLLQPFTLRVVFLAKGYSDRWLRSSEGRPTVAYVQLEHMVASALQSEGTLQPSLFADYRKELEPILYQKLVDIGKADEGARKRVSQRTDEICTALSAIIVEEKNGQVHCLNKHEDHPAALYDQATGTITVDGRQWKVSAKASRPKKEKTSGTRPAKGSTGGQGFGKWWSKNQFIVWASLIMLVVVPTFMIWGMLRIKDMAEQSNLKPDTTTVQQPAADTFQPDSIVPGSLLTDTTRTELQPDTILPDAPRNNP